MIDPEITTEAEEVEFDEYDPEPIALHDNGVVIFDPIEFSATFNCHAAMYSDGVMYVLCKDTHHWRSVEPVKAAKLQPIK
jgi:hypothetical protein